MVSSVCFCEPDPRDSVEFVHTESLSWLSPAPTLDPPLRATSTWCPRPQDLSLGACRCRPACSCRLACATGNSCSKPTPWRPNQAIMLEVGHASARPSTIPKRFSLTFSFSFIFSTQTLETEYTVTKRRQDGANSNQIYLAIISSTLYLYTEYI
jgi:hypothetical protein